MSALKGKIVMASGNAGKLREIERILGEFDVEIVPQSEFGVSDVAAGTYYGAWGTAITAYGIATSNGIESALHHAMEGTEIDLLYLWACFRLVQGVHSLAQVSLDREQKAALKELLGTSLGMATPYSFAEDFEDDEFDEVNLLPLRMEE